jgi:transposase
MPGARAHRRRACPPPSRAGSGIGHIRTKTHDYIRHGTLTLFAALNYLEGKLITRLAARPRASPGQACHQEWLAFLQLIDEQSPADLDIHIIADNYATHKHPQVKKWLKRHPRFHMHDTPTSSSWMNLVERCFGDLTAFITEKSFASTRELANAIITFLADRNDNPRRDVWRATGEDILRKIDTARRALVVSQAQRKILFQRHHTSGEDTANAGHRVPPRRKGKSRTTTSSGRSLVPRCGSSGAPPRHWPTWTPPTAPKSTD